MNPDLAIRRPQAPQSPEAPYMAQEPQARFTLDEVFQMLQAMSSAPPSNQNPYEPDASGQFTCDPNDPLCRHAMLQAGVTPPPPVNTVPNPPPHVRPAQGSGTGGGAAPGAMGNGLDIRRRLVASPRPLMGYGMQYAPLGLSLTRSAGVSPL
jgi:hypothetical protein